MISRLGMPGRGRPGRALASVAGVTLAAGLAAALLGSPVPAAAAPRQRVAAAAHGFLDAVSCLSASNCAAVGQRATSQGDTGTLAERWNGTNWSVVPTADPGQSTATRLTGVACPGAGDCLAVGWFNEAGGVTLPTAEKWNGTSWSLLSVPDVSGSTGTQLEGIACSSTSNCFAVGFAMGHTLTERWNGSAWSIVSSPDPNPTNLLFGVACPSASRCWAVGYTFPGGQISALTERWNGTSWTVVHTASAGGRQLISSSCAATTDCMAVGAGSNMFAIAQAWNGTAWADAPPKKPSGATITALKSVSCPHGATACESVGAKESSGERALAERWTGTKWTVQATPAISGSTFGSLNGISCTSASNCWAVGESDTTSARHPLIEKWNGTSWSVTAS